MTLELKSRISTFSPVHIIMFGVVILAVAAEALILNAYLTNQGTIGSADQGSLSTTTLANIQREALVLQVESYRMFAQAESGIQDVDSEDVELRRALMENQLRILVLNMTARGSVVETITERRIHLGTFDVARHFREPARLE